MLETESLLPRRNLGNQANASNTGDRRMQTYRLLLEEDMGLIATDS